MVVRQSGCGVWACNYPLYSFENYLLSVSSTELIAVILIIPFLFHIRLQTYPETPRLEVPREKSEKTSEQHSNMTVVMMHARVISPTPVALTYDIYT